MPGPKTTFALAVLAGIALVVSFAAVTKPPARLVVNAKRLTNDVWVTEQVAPEGFADIKARRFESIIDLRPDGEEPGQPSSETIAKVAQVSGMAFAYVPVTHGDIPSQSVDALAQSLALVHKPVLLYCRSGKRAARTWALAEASRAGGLDAVAIKAAVQSAGQSADDLSESISARIAARSNGH
ncbi:MAG: TIGR01244 family sulfur transferase [Dokdonella sp.]